MWVRLWLPIHECWTVSSHRPSLRFTSYLPPLLPLQHSRSPSFVRNQITTTGPCPPNVYCVRAQGGACQPFIADTEWLPGDHSCLPLIHRLPHSPLNVPSVSWAEAASLGCSPSSSEGVTPFTIFCCTDGGGVGGSDEGGVGGLLRLFWGVGWVLCARWHRETGTISWPHITSAFSSSLSSLPPTPRLLLFPKSIAIFLTLVSSWEQ